MIENEDRIGKARTSDWVNKTLKSVKLDESWVHRYNNST